MGNSRSVDQKATGAGETKIAGDRETQRKGETGRYRAKREGVGRGAESERGNSRHRPNLQGSRGRFRKVLRAGQTQKHVEGTSGPICSRPGGVSEIGG